jgi:hypothetical protein
MAITGEFCVGGMSSAFQKALQRELEKARLKEELKKQTENEAIQPAPAPPEQNVADQPKRKADPVPLSDSSSESSTETPAPQKPPVPRPPFAQKAKIPERPPPKKPKTNSPPPLPLPPKPRELPKKAAPDSESDEEDYDDDDDDDDFIQPAKKDSMKVFRPVVAAPSVQPAPEPAPAPAPAAAPEPIAEADYVEAKLPIFMYLIPLDATSTAQCQKFELDVPKVTINHEEGSVDVELKISEPTLKTDWVKETLKQAAEKKYRFYDEDSDANITLNQKAIMNMHPVITFVNHGQQKQWHDFFYELATDGAASNFPTTKWLHYQEMSIIDGRNWTKVPRFRAAIFINSTEGPFKR